MPDAKPLKAGPTGAEQFTTSDTVPAVNLPAMVGDSGSGGTKGAAPAPASGDAAAGKFLKADGTWAAPPGAWVLAGSWKHSTNVANVDFTNLGSYTEIMVVVRNITASVSGQRTVQVSTNNGSSFLTASGDYIALSSTGVESNATSLTAHEAGSTAARSGYVIIKANVSSAPKAVITPFFNQDSRGYMLIPTTSVINAIRVTNTSGGNLTAGSIFVYGK